MLQQIAIENVSSALLLRVTRYVWKSWIIENFELTHILTNIYLCITLLMYVLEVLDKTSI